MQQSWRDICDNLYGDGACILTEMGVCSDTDIVIPEKSPEGDTVTKIAEYVFYGAEDVK